MDREANRHRNMSKVYNGTNQITRIVCWRTHTRVSCLPPVFSNLSVPFFTASNHEKKKKKFKPNRGHLPSAPGRWNMATKDFFNHFQNMSCYIPIDMKFYDDFKNVYFHTFMIWRCEKNDTTEFENIGGKQNIILQKDSWRGRPKETP